MELKGALWIAGVFLTSLVFSFWLQRQIDKLTNNKDADNG